MNPVRRTVGATLLVLTASYYPVQLLVAARWGSPHPYSWTRNMISDLGMPECVGAIAGPLSDRYVCSPWHLTMSTEFVVIGVLAVAAAFTLAPMLPRTPLGRAVPALAVLNFVAATLVGVFPGTAGEVTGDDRIRAIAHPLGAAVELVSGLAIMIVVAWLWRGRRGYAAGTLALIGVTVVGIVTSVPSSHLGLGPGLAERFAVDPFVYWRAITGVVLLMSVRARQSSTASA